MAKRKIEIQYDSDGGTIVLRTDGSEYDLIAIMARALQKSINIATEEMPNKEIVRKALLMDTLRLLYDKIDSPEEEETGNETVDGHYYN